MSVDDDRLTPELQSLLAAEKDAAGPDGAARDRVAGRLARTLGVTLAAAGASAAASSGAQTVLPKALLGKSLAAKLLVAALVGGVGVGGVVTTVKLVRRHAAQGYTAPAQPASPVVTPPSAPAVPAASAPSLSAVDEPSPPSAPVEAAVEPPHPSAASHAEAHHAAHHGDLAAERALLTDARAAMQSSDAARALAILDDHAHRFAHGQLAEERDALRVAALWLAGDRAAARRYADEFAHRHPDSLFLPSVERAIQP